MKTFDMMNISSKLKKSITSMGFTNPTPIQENAIPLILLGKDLTALAHTGSGKTLAFSVGALEKLDFTNSKIQVLILCPTRELVMQTTTVLTNLSKYTEGARILSIFGGQNIDRQIYLLKKRPQIIVGTPGRVIDHLNRRTIRLDALRMLVLDEADEMLDMGFREDIDKILSTSPIERQTLLFSATMSKEIKKITNEYQRDSVTLKLDEEDLIPKIEQSYIMVKDSKNKDQILKSMLKNSNELSIIFCNTKRKVDSLNELLADEFNIEAIHGDMRQNQRRKVMDAFKSKKVDALITTDVAARGIDVNDIRRVINYDFPNDPKYYVHRIGRTARAGKDGKSVTFISPKEVSKLDSLCKELKIDVKESKPDYLKDLIHDNFLGDEKTTRLFISIGSIDGLTGTLLKKYIITETKIKEENISNIEVFDKFSFFNVDNDTSLHVIKTLSNLKYNKRRIGIEISKKPNTKFSKKRRSSSNFNGKRNSGNFKARKNNRPKKY